MPNQNNTRQKSDSSKRTKLNPQQRAQRSQQIMFGILGLAVILSLILSITLK